MAPASDLFDKLTDDLLCFILSYLPIKEAVRSSVLSTRWRYLYNQLPQLKLFPDILPDLLIPNPLAIAQVENIIYSILLLHSSDLEVFDLYTPDNWHFNSQSICKWVHCVASKNVKELSLRHFPAFLVHPREILPPAFLVHPREILPPSVFLCKKLRSLTLFDYTVSKIPTGFGGFNHLTYCLFSNGEFRNDSLALFLSHCPLLEELRLCRCIVPQKITISAPHIEFLNLTSVNPVEILTVNCPKLRYLSLTSVKDLRVNGLLFQDLSSAVSHVSIRDGTVIEILLNLRREETNHLSAERCAERMQRFKFLKTLYIVHPMGDKMDTLRTNLLQGLPHLETLSIKPTYLMSLRKNTASLDAPGKDPTGASYEFRRSRERSYRGILSPLLNDVEKEIDVLLLKHA